MTWAGVSLSHRLMGWSSAEAVKSMGAAVPLPFISGKALSPCVLLEVEGFRVEEPFPLQLSDEESSAKKDLWSPPWHPTTTFPKLLWAHLVAELPLGARLALLCSGPWDAADGSTGAGVHACKAIVTGIHSLIPQSPPGAAVPHARATHPSTGDSPRASALGHGAWA